MTSRGPQIEQGNPRDQGGSSYRRVAANLDRKKRRKNSAGKAADLSMPWLLLPAFIHPSAIDSSD